jgi:hypothetical protein
MSNTDYDTAPGIRASHLVHYADCPARYAYEIANRKESEALTRGSMVHAMLFEPVEVLRRFRVAPEVDRRKKAGKEEYAAFLADCASTGAECVSPDAFAVASDIAAAIKAHPNGALGRALVSEFALREQPFTWSDAATGILCKCKPDLVHDGIVWDVKTTRDCRPWKFGAACAQYHYLLKAAFYLRGLAANGITAQWVWIAVNAAPPHLVQLHKPTADDLARADERISELLALHAECERNQEWPGYDNGINEIILPAYVHGDEEEESTIIIT